MLLRKTSRHIQHNYIINVLRHLRQPLPVDSSRLVYTPSFLSESQLLRNFSFSELDFRLILVNYRYLNSIREFLK